MNKPQVRAWTATRRKAIAGLLLTITRKGHIKIRIRLRGSTSCYGIIVELIAQYLMECPDARILILENDTRCIERGIIELLKNYNTPVRPGVIWGGIFEGEQQVVVSSVDQLSRPGCFELLGRVDLVLVSSTVDTGLEDCLTFLRTKVLSKPVIAMINSRAWTYDVWDTELDSGALEV